MPKEKCERKVQIPEGAAQLPCGQELFEYQGWWVCPDHGLIKPVEESK